MQSLMIHAATDNEKLPDASNFNAFRGRGNFFDDKMPG
jgi:hypothetical protein